jgi:hypothetical protein
LVRHREHPEPRGGQAHRLTGLQIELGQPVARDLHLEAHRLGAAVGADPGGQLHARCGANYQHPLHRRGKAQSGVAVRHDVELVRAPEGDHMVAMDSRALGERYGGIATRRISPSTRPGSWLTAPRKL